MAQAASTLGALMTLRSLTGPTTLDSFVRFFMTKGNTEILSSPNLIVAAGKQASIITGEEVPIQSATVVSGSVSTTLAPKILKSLRRSMLIEAGMVRISS